MDKERELNVWCELILKYTKERVENDSVATRWIFDKATHDEWVLSLFPKHLASVNAYEQFYQLTGKDIRDCDWNSDVYTKDGNKIKVHQYFVDEHMTTAHDFKYELISLYKLGKLDVDKIKQLISMQRLCWITKEEDKKLSLNGYRVYRKNPLQAYKICGIEIYDEGSCDLSNIMCPSFDYNGNVGSVESINQIINKMQEYYRDNEVNGKKYTLFAKNNESYAWLYSRNNFLINVRIKKGLLKDINLFISGDKAKENFNKLKIHKDDIEKALGYELVWDENKSRKATRIGRFFSNADLSTEVEVENREKCFDFNIEDYDYISKASWELVHFHNVIIRFIERISE